MRRELLNNGDEPVTQYLTRIHVDRYPDEPQRSRKHHYLNPLIFGELQLSAWLGDDRRIPLKIGDIKADQDTTKEIWILFENRDNRKSYTIQHGQTAILWYSYIVGRSQWGEWFQRAVRFNTQELSVALNYPAWLDPNCIGWEIPEVRPKHALRTPIRSRTENDRIIFSWSTSDPDALQTGTRFRIDWRFRAPGAPGF